MKNQGFTLIELLAVIMILGLIGLIAIPSVIDVIKNSKEKLYESQVTMIESNAKKWGIDNINMLSETKAIYLNLSQLISDGYIEQSSLKDPRNTKINMNGCIVISYNDSYSKYEYEYVEEDCYTIKPLYADNSGASIPELTTGMIPVTYDRTNWIKADVTDKWYDYATKEWANAVTVTSTNRTTHLNAAPGSIIPMSDINTMWVWIPRYKYAIPAGSGERSINIVFESKTTSKSTGNAIDTNYLTHPAFTFGSTEVNGMWVGKFETTGTIGSPTILPNTSSLRSQTVKAMYDSSRAMENNATYGTSTDGNIHMAKDSEWGAVAYLSQSIYGKYGNSMYTGANKEIYQNKSSTYITGSSNGTPSQSTTNTQCAYNDIVDRGSGTGACGAGASTTGNIYGIYDMSGGAWEYTMSMYRPTDATSVTDNSGFTATTTIGTLPTSEYWERYTTATASTACSSGICYGSSLSETSGWYSDRADFVSASNPWSVRGGRYSTDATAGVFYFNDVDGSAYSGSSVRFVQMKP